MCYRKKKKKKKERKKKKKNEHRYRIKNTQVTLRIKFQLKQTVFMFWNKFAQN